MDKNKIEELAKKIYLKPSKKVIDLTLFLFNKVTNGLNELDTKFNKEIEKLDPLPRVNESYFSFDELRDDEIDLSLKLQTSDILANANKIEENFVCIKKVINDK